MPPNFKGEENIMLKPRYLAVAGLILTAAFMRLAPHPWNFSAVGAMALFAGAQFRRRWAALIVPLASMALSDAVLGGYPGLWLTYLSLGLIVCIGFLLRDRRNVLPIATA